MFKQYYRLTKPGIIYGNLISATAGYLAASRFHIQIFQFIGLLLGTSLVIGSACVFNNYIDRNIDTLMDRTKKRATVTGAISRNNILIFGTVLGLLGFVVLIILTNWPTLLVGIIGYVDYIVLYGYFKRRSVWGTEVGSISGAVPILAGYTAYSDRIDAVGIALFLVMVFWQMPHFYSIAMFRLEDYKRAKLPVMPVVKGYYATKVKTIVYIILFIMAMCYVWLLGYGGFAYIIVSLALGIMWLRKSFEGFKFDKTDTPKWAKKMFGLSLLILLSYSLILSLGRLLP